MVDAASVKPERIKPVQQNLHELREELKFFHDVRSMTHVFRMARYEVSDIDAKLWEGYIDQICLMILSKLQRTGRAMIPSDFLFQVGSAETNTGFGGHATSIYIVKLNKGAEDAFYKVHHFETNGWRCPMVNKDAVQARRNRQINNINVQKLDINFEPKTF